MTKKKVVHLHWAYKRGPVMLRGVTKAYSICGIRVSSDDVTSFVDDTTCKSCIAKAKAKAKEEKVD